MEDIVIINLSNGPFDFNRQLFEATSPDKFNLSVIPRLRYSGESDYVGFQLDITITADERQVLKIGFLIGMMVKGWSEMLKSGVNLTNERERLIGICKNGWLVATGIIAQATTVSQTKDFILPPIDMARFANEVLLISSVSKND